jgi:hypothetical protein
MSSKALQNQRLLGQGELLSSQNDKLKQGLREINQAEVFAISTNTELARNSETLQRGIKNVIFIKYFFKIN